jgi:hypothetical protein
MMNTQLRLGGFAVALLALVAPWSTGCGSSSTQIRFVHVLPTGIGNIDILVDDRVVVTNLQYGSTNGVKYKGISSGTHTVEVRPTGNTSNGSDVVNTQIKLQGGKDYTGVVDFTTNSNLDIFTDNNTTPTNGNTNLRVIHVDGALNGVDVYAIPPGTGISGVSPQIANVPFDGVSAYTPLSAATYELIVTQTGTKNIEIDATNVPAFNNQQIKTMILYDTSPNYLLLADLN